MDPNETLRMMDNLTRHFARGLLTAEEYAGEMAALWQALHEWVAKGGFLPDDWR